MNTVRRNQSGIVSIMVTMIMMVVISLIVIGFAQVARRNQRETLDRQLSTQAFYAAESGVNDVVTALKTGAVRLKPAYSTNCTSFMHDNGAVNSRLDGSNIGYTCLLANDKPPSVIVNVPLGSSRAVPLIMNNRNNGTLNISWTANTKTGSAVGNCPVGGTTSESFTPFTTWNKPNFACPFGLLRFDLYHDTGSYNAASMANNSVAVYMVPAQNASPNASPSDRVSFQNPSRSVYVKNVRCSDTVCKGTLSGLASGPASYYMRLSAVYQDLGDVTITGAPGTTFSGAAIVVDSTGQAQDQLRRIQVRIPLVDTNGVILPVNSLQAVGGLCKRYNIDGPGASASPDFNTVSPLCSPS